MKNMVFKIESEESRQHFYVGIIALFLLFFLAFVATISERAFIHDGAEWFYLLIEKKSFRFHETFWRQFNAIFQIPSVLMLQLIPDIDLKYPVWALHFTYNFHLFFSMLFVWLVTLKKKLHNLFYFSVLACFLGALSTHGFSVGIGSDTLSVFWPLFILSIIRNEKSIRDLIIFLILSLCLAFTYETAILCYLSILIVLLLQVKNKEKSKFDFVYIGITSLGFFWCLWRLIGPGANYGQASASLYFDIPFLKYALFFIFLFTAWLVYELFIDRKNIIISLIPFFLILSYMIYFLSSSRGVFGQFFVRTFFDMRLYSVPIAVAFALIYIVVSEIEKHKANSGISFKSSKILPFLFLAVFSGFLFDIQISKDWRVGLEKFRKYLYEHPGCNNWSKQEYQDYNVGWIMADWTLPFLSVVSDTTYRPISLVFTPENGDPDNRDYCAEFIKDGKVIDKYGILFPYENTRFSFDEIRKSK